MKAPVKYQQALFVFFFINLLNKSVTFAFYLE